MSPESMRLLPYQYEAVYADARFTWNCWARQTGKSFTFALRRLLRGLLRGRNQIILSAGARQSREVMEKVRMHCHALHVAAEAAGCDLFAGSVLRGMELRLPGGVRVIGLPANPMTARGYTGDVFLDEFAMHRDDDAIWASLFPTILRGEGELDVASTPRGRSNLFARLRDNALFQRRTVTLADATAAGLDVDADALRAAMADEAAWRQEFCCEFADEATSFLTHELIRRCQDAGLTTEVDWDRLDRRGVDVVAGVDVGRLRDVTVAWLWERDGEAFVARGVTVLSQAPFDEQEAMLTRLLDRRAVRRCCIDATGMGLHLAERLAQRYGEHRVEGVTFTAASKNEMAGAVRVLAERGLLRIPVDEAIVNDWHSLSRSVSRSGHVRYDAGRSAGGHADRFWAAALGIHAADGIGGTREVLTTGPLRFARAGAW